MQQTAFKYACHVLSALSVAGVGANETHFVESKPFVSSPPPPGVLGCSLVLSVQAMYSASDDVIELTPSNFNREVIQSDSLWLVEFYAPW